VAISSPRWLWLEDHPVTFRWRDSRHPNQQRRRTLSVHAFLRRFLLPVLPLGFVRIRYFGWCAHGRRNQWLPLGLQLLAAATPHRTAHTPTAAPPWLWACAICGGPMQASSDSLRSKSAFGRQKKQSADDPIFLNLNSPPATMASVDLRSCDR
jgi:hypothetical protein